MICNKMSHIKSHHYQFALTKVSQGFTPEVQGAA